MACVDTPRTLVYIQRSLVDVTGRFDTAVLHVYGDLLISAVLCMSFDGKSNLPFNAALLHIDGELMSYSPVVSFAWEAQEFMLE